MTRSRQLILGGFVLVLMLESLGSCKKKDDDNTNSGGGGNPAAFVAGTYQGSVNTTAADPGGCNGNHNDTSTVRVVITSADANTVTGTVSVDGGGAQSFSQGITNDAITISLQSSTCGGSGTSDVRSQLKMNSGNLAATVSGTSCEPCSPGNVATETPWTITGSGTLTKQ